MICAQPPALQQRKLVLKGTLDLPRSMKLFGYAMPFHSEFEEMVRSGHPELVKHKNAMPARSGDLLIYPERNGAFPALFEYVDAQTGKRYCIDTRNYMHIRGIALFLPRGTYRFRFDGDRMLFFPDREPIVMQFPQYSDWYPYDPHTFIPVSHGGITDPSGIMTGRFLQRTEENWLGCPSRDVNMGNNEEKYIYVSERPSTPRGVFVWDGAAAQPTAQPAAPEKRRRIVQVSASSPVSAGQAPPKEQSSTPKQEKLKITYLQFMNEWNVHRALHNLDPARFSDPGPVPEQQTFERLLREGKIRVEK